MIGLLRERPKIIHTAAIVFNPQKRLQGIRRFVTFLITPRATAAPVKEQSIRVASDCVLEHWTRPLRSHLAQETPRRLPLLNRCVFKPDSIPGIYLLNDPTGSAVPSVCRL